MNDAQLEKAAGLLADARRAVSRIETLPDDAKPQSITDMYALQETLVSALGGRGGFKAGPAAPQMKPVEGMICAPLPAENIVESGSRVAVPGGGLVAVETEIAFKLGQDLPPKDGGYSDDEIKAAISEAVPTIEVVWSRLSDLPASGVFSIIGDLQMHGSLVVGAPISDWRNTLTDALTVKVTVGGKEVVNIDKAPHPAGSPFSPLIWLVNEGACTRGGLKAGEIVTCGSYSGVTPVKAPVEIVAGFPNVSEDVKVEFVLKS